MRMEIWQGVESYSFFINLGTVLGILVFVLVMYFRTKSIKQTLFNLAVCMLIIQIGAIGGEIIRTWNNWEFRTFSEFIHVMTSERSGTHFIGRVLFAAWMLPIAYRLIEKILKTRFVPDKRNAYDAVSFYFVIQHIFSRIGCFMNGCCYGKYYNGPGNVVFPNMIVEYPTYPSQLIEAGMTAALLILLIIKARGKKPLLGRMLTAFGMIIFISEFFMDQGGVLRIAGINVIQAAALICTVTGLFYINKSFEKGEKKEQKKRKEKR